MERRMKRRKSMFIDMEEYAQALDPDALAFVMKTGMFEKWQDQYRNLLIASLKARTVATGKYIQEQGQPFEEILFLASGTAKCLAHPYEHRMQYPQYYKPLPLNAEEQAVFSAMDFDRFRSMAVPTIRVDNKGNPGKRLSVLQCHRLHHMSKRPALRRIKGYTAAEGYEFNRLQELCFVGEGEIIGDTEMLLSLPTVVFSYLCITDCKVLSLSIPSFEKIFKKNERTVEAIRMCAEMKLLNRIMTVPGVQCPLLAALTSQLAAIAPDKKSRTTRRHATISKPEEDEKTMINRIVLEMTPGHWKRSPNLKDAQKQDLWDGLKRVVRDSSKHHRSLKKTVIIKLDDKMWS